MTSGQKFIQQHQLFIHFDMATVPLDYKIAQNVNFSYCYVYLSTIPSTALEEALDISIHLKPLRMHCEMMEECEYDELPQRFPPFFHCVSLVWANSEHYRLPSRLVIFLQEVSNLLIEVVCV